GGSGGLSRAEAWQRAQEILDLIGLPSHPAATPSGLGTAALKKLELARALATRPRLLLADESLGGLDASEMERAATLLESIRSRMNITIIWVEHIMGVLMRIVDRVIVLPRRENFRRRAHAGRGRSAGYRSLSGKASIECCRLPASLRATGHFRYYLTYRSKCRVARLSASSDRTAPARPH